MEKMEKKKMEIGSDVMVPRTGGGYSKGKVLSIQDKLALVSFPLGDTYRGELNPYGKDETATKIIPTKELILI